MKFRVRHPSATSAIERKLHSFWRQRNFSLPVCLTAVHKLLSAPWHSLSVYNSDGGEYRKKKYMYISERKVFWTALLTGLPRSSEATNWPACLSSSSKELLHCKADSGETLRRRRRRRKRYVDESHEDSDENVNVTQTAGSWFFTSSSGQRTWSDSLAWRRLFVGTDVLMRARLGEEEAQAASSLLVLLPAQTRKSNISIPSVLSTTLVLQSPWLLHSAFRHNVSVKIILLLVF